jgi:hypothetical protein
MLCVLAESEYLGATKFVATYYQAYVSSKLKGSNAGEKEADTLSGRSVAASAP